MKKPDDRIRVRLPSELSAALSSAASKHGRSISEEIIARLRVSLAQSQETAR